MFDTLQTLEISAEELAVIEAALHTQAKILNVQAKAGGSDARHQLNQVKRALATVSHHKPCETPSGRPCKSSWFGRTRIFG